MPVPNMKVSLYVDESDINNNKLTTVFANGAAQLPISVYVYIDGEGAENFNCVSAGLLKNEQSNDITTLPTFIAPDEVIFLPGNGVATPDSDSPTRDYQAFPNNVHVGNDASNPTHTMHFLATLPASTSDYELMAFAQIEDTVNNDVFYIASNIQANQVIAGEECHFGNDEYIKITAKEKPPIQINQQDITPTKDDHKGLFKTLHCYQYIASCSSNDYEYNIEAEFSGDSKTSDNYLQSEQGFVEQGFAGDLGGVNVIARAISHQNSIEGRICQWLAGDDSSYTYTANPTAIGTASAFIGREDSIQNDCARETSFENDMTITATDEYGGKVIYTYKCVARNNKNYRSSDNNNIKASKDDFSAYIELKGDPNIVTP